MASGLMDYVTGDYIRPATTDEMARCLAAIESGEEEGVILVDLRGEVYCRGECEGHDDSARRCWVDGPLVPKSDRDAPTSNRT